MTRDPATDLESGHAVNNHSVVAHDCNVGNIRVVKECLTRFLDDLIVDVGDVHAMYDVVAEVVTQHPSQDVKRHVTPGGRTTRLRVLVDYIYFLAKIEQNNYNSFINNINVLNKL